MKSRVSSFEGGKRGLGQELSRNRNMQFEKGGNGRQFASQSQTYLGYLGDGGLGIAASSKFQQQ